MKSYSILRGEKTHKTKTIFLFFKWNQVMFFQKVETDQLASRVRNQPV